MCEDKIANVKMLLYDYSKDEVKKIISQTKDPEILYMYMYNYNWDNGFEIPQEVLKNESCDLSTALLIFYRADGVTYLFKKECSQDSLQWVSFVQNLYNSILKASYQNTSIGFKPDLSKIQLFKLKKILTEQENIFLQNIKGKDLNIEL